MPLDDILAAVGRDASRIKERPLTAFDTLVGAKWQGGLLVVGRAVNGWHEGWNPESMTDPLARRHVAESLVRATGTDGKCPMTWVSDYWSTGREYNTAGSAFWRVTRAVTAKLQIADVGAGDWPSWIAWTNLYRVAPHAGGNPSAALQNVQHDMCIAALATDLDRLRPSRLLFLTGYDWAEPFLNGLGEWHQSSSTAGPVQCAGELRREQWTGAVVVAQHPQGKPEAAMVQAIVATFGKALHT